MDRIKSDGVHVVETELEEGESLLWSGEPKHGLVFRPEDIYMIPFHLVWCGVVLYFTIGLFGGGEDSDQFGKLLALVVGLPFSAIGLYLLVGRFFADAKMRSRTFYGLTDRRVITVSGVFRRRTASIAIETLENVTLSERPNGSGTIWFRPPEPIERFCPAGVSMPSIDHLRAPKFELIADAKSVLAAILEAQEMAAQPGAGADVPPAR